MLIKILLAGLAGGILMFAWEGLAHEALPLGEAGVSALPNEPAMIAAVKENVKTSGFYIFPGGEMLDPKLTKEQRQAAMEKMVQQAQTGPAGIMILHPEGEQFDMVRNFLSQCLFDILAMLLAGFLLSQTTLRSFGARLLFVTLIGLIPTLKVELPLWNWYGFPPVYTASQATVHLVGFLIGGLVVAALVKPGVSKSAVAGAA